MGKRILLIEHHPEPHDDRASAHLAELGFELDWRHPWNGDDLETSLDDLAGSVIYGGAQNVDQQDQYPYLAAEMRWIDRCLENDIPLLGLCLGGQLIAHALGAKVGPHDAGLHEFGYYPIRSVDTTEHFLSGELYVMQCHYHGFELPEGARLLARGKYLSKPGIFLWRERVRAAISPGMYAHYAAALANFRLGAMEPARRPNKRAAGHSRDLA